MYSKHRSSRRGLPHLLLTLALLVAALFSRLPANVAQASMVWQTQTVDSAGDVGRFSSIVLNSAGDPVISHEHAYKHTDQYTSTTDRYADQHADQHTHADGEGHLPRHGRA